VLCPLALIHSLSPIIWFLSPLTASVACYMFCPLVMLLGVQPLYEQKEMAEGGCNPRGTSGNTIVTPMKHHLNTFVTLL
jgi:hypothetical protein